METFGRRPEDGEGASHAGVWDLSIQAENIKYKSPEAEACLACSRDTKEPVCDEVRGIMGIKNGGQARQGWWAVLRTCHLL